MNSEQLALVRGWADTRATLRAWQARPLPVVGAWAAASLGVAAATKPIAARPAWSWTRRQTPR